MVDGGCDWGGRGEWVDLVVRLVIGGGVVGLVSRVLLRLVQVWRMGKFCVFLDDFGVWGQMFGLLVFGGHAGGGLWSRRSAWRG